MAKIYVNRLAAPMTYKEAEKFCHYCRRFFVGWFTTLSAGRIRCEECGVRATKKGK